MRRTIYTVIFVISCVMSCVAPKKQIVEKKMNNYIDQWTEIEALQQKELPKSVLEKVDSIYRSALAEENYEQVLKAIIFQMNSVGVVEENDKGANKIFNDLKKDAELFPQPAKSIVYSIIGQMYEDYYRQNIWTIKRRTRANVDLEDIHTWDARSLTEEAIRYYERSIQEAKILQNEPVDAYKEILQTGYDIKYQPTLYDLLANRALGYYSSEFNVHSLPQQTFVINDERYFSPAGKFSKMKIQTPDTLSPAYLSLEIYQNLLRFHLDRSNHKAFIEKPNDGVTALIDADLRRISYLRKAGRYADNDKLYEEALIGMNKDYEAYEQNARVVLELGDFYYRKGQEWRANKKEENKSGYTKAYEMCEHIETTYPGQLDGHVAALKELISKKELNLAFEGTQLPNEPFLAKLKYRNVNTVYQTIYKLTEKEVLKYKYERGRYIDDKYYTDLDFIKEIASKEKYVQKRIKLVEQSDFQYYTTEIKTEPLKKGFYFVLLSDTEDILDASTVYTTSLLQVSPLMARDRTIYSSSVKNMEVAVTDRKSGQPLSGAKVTACIRRNKDKMVSFTGNEKGIAHKQIGKHGHCKYYKVTHNGNQLFVFNPSYGNYFHEPSHDKTAILFTDRSVYRPGQTVFFKAILYKPSGNGEKKLLGKTSVKVSLYDVNWQAVAEKKITSNEFGSIDGSFAIPQGLLNGRMTIDCHGYARTAVQVEEYKRPTFEVKFEPVAENFVLNKPVKISGNAKALSGYAIDNANIQYRVVRNTRHRYYYRWWRPLKEETREISSGVLKTDEKGNFNIEFMALADDVKDDQKIYTYTVTADVTDINGETRSASTDVHISNKPLLIKTNLKEKIYSGSLNNYTIETTNLNGEPTPATLHVEISSLEAPNKILRRRRWNDEIDVQTLTEAEFRKDFPLDEYNNELNPENFKELKTLSRYELNPEENKKLNLSSLKQSGYYKIKLTAKDQQGITVENVRYVYLFGDDPVKISSMDDWLAVVKKSGEPGENVAFHIAGAHENSHVYCELMHKNRIVESKWVKTGANPIKLTYPVKEEHRGGFTLQFSMVQDNRIYKSTQRIIVPYTNKMLDVELSTFRDQLLPGENETWTMLVKNKEGEKEDAEIVASLYDASLDFILPHRWPGPETIYSQYVDAYTWRWTDKSIEQLEVSREYHQKSYPTTWQYKVFYTDINWYNETYRKAFYANASSYGNRPLMVRGLASVSEPDVDYELNEIAIIEDDLEVAESEMVFMSADYTVVGFGKKAKNEQPAKDGAIKSSSSPDMPEVKVRTNFNETAFFYPCLRTNEKGETLIEFTIPEALTRWKLLSFAHTKDLKAGSYSNELITQKKVAISANPPRFFRENDKIEFRAKVNNLTEEELSGQAQLELYDALTMKPIDHIIKSEKSTRFEIASDGSVALGWQLSVPEDVQAIVYRVKTQAGTHSDGEEKTIPVLKNSMLVTETLPFSVRAKQEKSLTFERLANNNSTTLKNHRLTLEFTSAPAWYAVQALPYIMEYPYECAEQTFSRYYANTLATTIVNKTPRIKEIFNLWKMSDSKALVSNLEKNQELKQVLLEETPWVLHAKSETERKKRIGLLFDLNRMSSEMTRAFNKLKNIQNTDGGFPWFKGFSSSRYITQHLVSGMAHLVKLDAMQEKNKKDTDRMIKKGLAFLDYETWKDYDALIRNKAEMEKKQIGSIQLHYLYACSFSKHKPGEGKRKTAFEYYLSQAEKFWKEFTTYEKAMAALILHRNGKEKEARAVIRSLKEYAQQSEELGMYWKDNVAGYFWYQAPIETQAMLIEAFDEVAADKQSVEEMKIWLLRNKQTNDWKTTKATSVAIYALLKTGSNLLDESRLLEVKIAGRTLADVAEEEVVPEAGTGYVKTSWNGSNITKDMGRLEVKNPNNSGIAWGAMYWQYFEQLDKITAHETNLKMNKQLFLRTLTDKGEELQPLNDKNVLKVGDLVRVRMELRADRDYEYVHLKDMRASGFEPVSTLSGCRFQGGLWYYESIKDASTNFFITYLRKGTYVFEYDLRVSHKGDFSNGITMFQCMYAPEFSSHSEGVRVIVK